ncbi:MAG: outer membrane lipoprotein-sorting protein, partial [Verrucomicrobiota bacterium]
MRTRIIFLLIAAVVLTSGFRKSTFRNGESIMAELKDRQITTSEVELLNMSVIDESGNVEIREFISVIKPDADGKLRYLVRFLSPEEIRGVTLLTLEQTGGGKEQYLYLPAMGQARQITGQQQSGTFMGSDFSFGDLSKENPEDHQYYRLIDGEHEGQEVYRTGGSVGLAVQSLGSVVDLDPPSS